jgi:hypothetical protein
MVITANMGRTAASKRPRKNRLAMRVLKLPRRSEAEPSGAEAEAGERKREEEAGEQKRRGGGGGGGGGRAKARRRRRKRRMKVVSTHLLPGGHRSFSRTAEDSLTAVLSAVLSGTLTLSTRPAHT